MNDIENGRNNGIIAFFEKCDAVPRSGNVMSLFRRLTDKSTYALMEGDKLFTTISGDSNKLISMSLRYMRANPGLMITTPSLWWEFYNNSLNELLQNPDNCPVRASVTLKDNPICNGVSEHLVAINVNDTVPNHEFGRWFFTKITLPLSEILTGYRRLETADIQGQYDNN